MTMESSRTEQPPAISAEQISTTAERIAREPELPGKAGLVLEAVREWASPSLVAGLRRDQSVPSGWLAVPELTSGELPPGFGDSFAKLLAGLPAKSLERPKLIQPAQAFGGVKVKPRDSWLLPWSAGRVSGFLVVRGIPRPYSANLPDAIAQLCEPIWPLVAAGLEDQPVAPEAEEEEAAPPPGQPTELEQAAEEASRLAQRLTAAARREQERVTTDAGDAGLRPRLAAAEADLAEARQTASALQQQVESLETAGQGVEAEAAQLRERLAERESQGTDTERLEQLLADKERELEEARTSATSLTERVEALQRDQEVADAARKSAEAETEQLRERLASLESQDADSGKLEQLLADRERELEEARSSATSLQEQVDALQGTEGKVAAQLEQAQAAQKRAELALAYKEAEHEEGGRHVTVLQERVKTLETEKATTQSELQLATKHLAALRTRMEGLERTGRAEQNSLREKEEELEALRARAAGAEARLATVESERLEERASTSAGKPEEADGAREAVVSALAALRRTPFVPPMLRVAFSSVEELFEAAPRVAEGTPPPMRVLLLDRNITRLDAMAADLEHGGIEPLLAHYTEEVSFFLKTPEGPRTAAVICDVMAFRPEQDLLDVFRSWRREVSALTIVLTHQTDNPLEEERVSQVPLRTAGRLAMPLTPEAITAAIWKAQSDRAAERPATLSGPPRGSETG